jgi:PPOX class probable F420-dependent enzyme
VASQRSTVSMLGEEVAAFLREQTKVQVGTIGPEGEPHLTTLFHVVLDGRIAFWTYGRSQKIVNLRRDPRISCLLETGEEYAELRGVSIRGTARLVEEYDEVRAIGALVVRRMAGNADLGQFGDDLVAQQARKRVAVVVEPTKVASWDHAKMAGPPGS